MQYILSFFIGCRERRQSLLQRAFYKQIMFHVTIKLNFRKIGNISSQNRFL